MKKFIYLLLFLAIGKTATAQTISFYVPDVEVVPGGTAFYSLNINVGDGYYKDFNYTIQFPETGFSTPSSNNSTVNPDWIDGSVMPGRLTNGRGNVSCMGSWTISPTPPIPSGDIEIGTVAFSVANDVELGEYDVTISGIKFIINGFESVTLPDPVTFKVKVVNTLTVVLDENSTEAPAAAEGVNVLVKRTIAANEWGTICLPFAMSAEQVTAAFGDDVKLCDFTGCDITEDSAGDVTAIDVNFSPVSAIEANHPYIIKVSSPVTQFSVENVDIDPADEPSVDCDGMKVGKIWYYNSFVGTYAAQTTVPDLCLFLSGGQFYYSKGLTKMKAFRGYFDFIYALSSVENAAGAKFGLVIDDGGTTSLNEELRMKNEEFGNGWYTLDGIKLNGEPKKKGIYIKDGRKVVVK